MCYNSSMNTKEWTLSKRHPCIICGHLCYYRSTLCRQCYHSILKVGGLSSPRWKGGKWIDKRDGYVYLSMGGHNIKKEHRHIIEQQLGRPLSKTEIVHHINGIKADNRLENLIVLRRNQHDTKTLQHAWQARIQDLEAELGRLKNQYTIPH